MKDKQNNILFISHSAARSGAPFVLLYLLQWVKANSSYSFDVLLLQDGPLKSDFELIADRVFVLPEYLAYNSFFYRVKRKLKLAPSEEGQLKKAFSKIGVEQYSIVYGNTIVCLPVLLTLKKIISAKFIIAIHELTTSIENFHSRAYVESELAKLDCIVAGSQAVSHNLQQRYAIPASIITVVHAFIHTHNLPKNSYNILEAAGIPANRFIIGGAGTPEWRKGMDLIVPLGMYLQEHYPVFDFHIVWVGGVSTESFVRHLLNDIEKTGLQDRITLVESTKEYLEYINSYDVFTMLSREDPFPLVSIEAAFLQKPILMFSGTGGTEEIIQNGGGIAVPYMSIAHLAEAIIGLAGNAALRTQMGKQLHTEVVNHYNSEVACKKVAAILHSFVPST